MHNALPPLNALRAFEAAARHGSMTKAAEELSVTPGALSHQIRGLEEFLDVRLFERLPRSIELTEAGRVLQPGLEGGFRQVREAVAALRRASDPNVLTVSTPPGLTAKWLAPRLYRFQAANPDIELRIASSLRNADFATDGVDMAIRNLPVGGKAGRGLAQETIKEIMVLPVCAPAVNERFGPFERPADLAHAPLIEDHTFIVWNAMPLWGDWFAAADAPEAAHAGKLGFNSPDHALDAAVEGAGVLLAHDILAHDDLKSGRLIAPFPLSLETGRVFALVYPQASADRPNVAAFRAWLHGEVAAMADCAALAQEAAAD